jgi:hypothetical protein
MQDDRTIAVNAHDLLQLAHFAAQGILVESEQDDIVGVENEADLRAELGQMLAMAFGYSNQAADALGAGQLPYGHDDILDALAGKLTSRRLAA